MTHPIARYVPLLIEGDLGGLRALFRDVPRVNDPHLGWVETSRFEQFVAASHDGLVERSASVRHLATTTSGTGAVEECLLTLLRRGTTIELPVAVAGETGAGALLESVRVYHSMWPLIGMHLLREPILSPPAALLLPDVVGRYHDCLARGDLAGILRQFDPEGTLHESRGGSGVHRGGAALRRFFAPLVENGRGIGLEHCSLTDDGACCALEYNIKSWGRGSIEPQAGAAVYERSSAGLLADVRLYDDIEPASLGN